MKQDSQADNSEKYLPSNLGTNINEYQISFEKWMSHEKFAQVWCTFKCSKKGTQQMDTSFSLPSFVLNQRPLGPQTDGLSIPNLSFIPMSA